MNQHDVTDESKFLQNFMDELIPCVIFLCNGIKLRGQITSHDDNCVFLSRDRQTQMIYKSAISTVLPDKVDALLSNLGRTRS